MALSYGQVSIATSGTTQIVAGVAELVSKEETKRWVQISNQGGHPVFLGDSSVTSSNGFQVISGTTVGIYLFAEDSLYGVATGGASVISYLESGA